MALDRFVADRKRLTDFAIALSLRNQADHFAFARAEQLPALDARRYCLRLPRAGQQIERRLAQRRDRLRIGTLGSRVESLVPQAMGIVRLRSPCAQGNVVRRIEECGRMIEITPAQGNFGAQPVPQAIGENNDAGSQ